MTLNLSQVCLFSHTGMILELDSTSVEHLLESPEDLTDAIDKAMKALNDRLDTRKK